MDEAATNRGSGSGSGTTDARLSTWMDGYRGAWNSNDPAEIGALFSDDATYRTEPYAEPARGRQSIVEKWLELRDEPGQTTFSWEPLVVTAEVQVIQARTEYLTDPPHVYSNLWVLRLDDDGRCTEFTEWYMKHRSS